MKGVLQSALAYALRGWPVFPLHGIVNGSCTCGRGDCSSPGKHPLVHRGLYEASTDPHVIKEWWRRWRRANIGLVTGAGSGIAVVDVDLPEALKSFGHLIEVKLPTTLTGLTGGGGVHLLYATDDPSLGNSAGGLPGVDPDLPGVDLRANGGYIVAPPSVHRSGHRYQWLDEDRILASAPEWLKQPERSYLDPRMLGSVCFDGGGTPYGLAVLRAEIERLGCAPIGTRNHELNRSAFALAQLVGGGELLESAARHGLLVKGVAIGLQEWECHQTIDSAFEAGLRRPRCAPHRVPTTR